MGFLINSYRFAPQGEAVEPDAPTSLIAVGADGSVSLMWTAPASDGGSPITDYVVEWRQVT